MTQQADKDWEAYFAKSYTFLRAQAYAGTGYVPGRPLHEKFMDAEDAVADTYLKQWRQYCSGNYRSEDLYRSGAVAVRRKAENNYSRLRNERRREMAWLGDWLRRHVESPEDVVEEQEARERLAMAVEHVMTRTRTTHPEWKRRILEMVLVGDRTRSPGDMVRLAEELGADPEKLRRLAYRVRRELARALGITPPARWRAA